MTSDQEKAEGLVPHFANCRVVNAEGKPRKRNYLCLCEKREDRVSSILKALQEARAEGRAERDGEVSCTSCLDRTQKAERRADDAEARCDRLEGQKWALVSARGAVTEELGRVASLLYRNGLKEEARELDKFLLAHRTIHTLPLFPSEPSSGEGE